MAVEAKYRETESAGATPRKPFFRTPIGIVAASVVFVGTSVGVGLALQAKKRYDSEAWLRDFNRRLKEKADKEPEPREPEAKPAKQADPLVELGNRVGAADSIISAIEIASPKMVDTFDELSLGHWMLARWSVVKMTWGNLNDVKTVSFGIAMKDSEEARGKRICASGTVIEIHKQKAGARKYFTGGIMSPNGDMVRFTAVRSTGDVVAKSWARFCGIVTEKNSYKNSGGGTTHSIAAVGMFDLPANRKKPE